MNKKIYSCIALVAIVATACEKDEKDFPIVGEINMQGTYVTYVHGTQGWIKEDALGIFVTSEGKEQTNLEYAPASYSVLEESEYVPGYFMYGDPVETTTFKAVGVAAGFKQGEHNIYAYTPYNAANKDLTAVALPDNTTQVYSATEFNAGKQYVFAWAKLETPLTEYSAEVVDFGKFNSPSVAITIPASFGDSFKGGEKVTKAVLTSTIDIALADGKIDLSTGEVTGTKSKSIEFTLPEEGLEVQVSAYSSSMGTLYGAMYADWETASAAEYTLTLTIDGKEYTATGTPYTKWATEGNVNMYNAFKFE